MPLIAWAVAAYVAGLLSGFTPTLGATALVVGVLAALATLPAAFRGRVVPLACALLFAAGLFVARDTARRDAACSARAWAARDWSAVRAPLPCGALGGDTAGSGLLERWRKRTGVTIDSLFGADAPL